MYTRSFRGATAGGEPGIYERPPGSYGFRARHFTAPRNDGPRLSQTFRLFLRHAQNSVGVGTRVTTTPIIFAPCLKIRWPRHGRRRQRYVIHTDRTPGPE